MPWYEYLRRVLRKGRSKKEKCARVQTCRAFFISEMLGGFSRGAVFAGWSDDCDVCGGALRVNFV